MFVLGPPGPGPGPGPGGMVPGGPGGPPGGPGGPPGGPGTPNYGNFNNFNQGNMPPTSYTGPPMRHMDDNIAQSDMVPVEKQFNHAHHVSKEQSLT